MLASKQSTLSMITNIKWFHTENLVQLEVFEN